MRAVSTTTPPDSRTASTSGAAHRSSQTMTKAALPAGRSVGHVREVLLVDEPAHLAVQVAEGRQFVALVELEADGVAGLVLGHEHQVQDAHRAVGHELLHLWGDVPVEAVAGEGDHRVADWSQGHIDLLVSVSVRVGLSWPAPLPSVLRTLHR